MNNRNQSRIDNILLTTRKRLAESIVNYIFLKMIAYTLTILLIIISINNEFKVTYSLIPLFTFEYFILILLCTNHQRPKEDMIYLFMFENFMYGTFILSILVIIECSIDLVYLLILPSFHLLINLITVKFQVQMLGFPFFFLINLVFYICALFLILKIVNLMIISFYICFWPLYLAGFVILILIMKNFFDFFDRKYYLIKNFGKLTMKIAITVIGSMFIAMHILSIYYLGSK
jgi:hypothetical protein